GYPPCPSPQGGERSTLLAVNLRSVFRRKPAQPRGDRWLIIGLGNPGEDYEESRHNVGFRVVDELARRHNGKVRGHAAKSLTGAVRDGGRELILAKPQTMMNLSGSAAKRSGPNTPFHWSVPSSTTTTWIPRSAGRQ